MLTIHSNTLKSIDGIVSFRQRCGWSYSDSLDIARSIFQEQYNLSRFRANKLVTAYALLSHSGRYDWVVDNYAGIVITGENPLWISRLCIELDADDDSFVGSNKKEDSFVARGATVSFNL
jgi:hypothetical protein